METTLRDIDGFWRDKVSHGTKGQKRDYLNSLIRSQTIDAKNRWLTKEQRAFSRTAVRLAKDQLEKL